MRLKRPEEYPTGTITPEHDARGSADHGIDNDGSLHSEIKASYEYVDSILATSDYVGCYAWHGWAIREAFLAGVTHARAMDSA